MRRAAFIVIAVAVIGCGILAAISGVGATVGVLRDSNGAIAAEQPAIQVVTRVIAISVGLAFVGFGVWAVLAGIAFVRRKRWARTPAIVICGLCLMVSAMFVLGWLVTLLGEALNPSSGTSPGLFDVFVLLVMFVPFALFVWALFFLNRIDVKTEFGWTPAQIYVPPPPPVLPAQFPSSDFPRAPRRPTLVAVIAWLMIISAGSTALMLPLYLAQKSWIPALFFGRLVTGWPGIIAVVLLSGVYAIAGIGLFKAKNWARILTIAIHVYAVVNVVLMFWNRGQFEQFERTILAKMSQVYSNAGLQITPEMLEPFMKIIWFSMLVGLVIPLLIIWYLVKQKNLGPAQV